MRHMVWHNKNQKTSRSRILIASLVCCVFSFAPFALVAYAHEGVDHASDAEHAEQDMADTPISEIERLTNSNKQRIFTTTGVEPGSAKSLSAKNKADANLQAVSADPGVSGAWSSAISTQVIPIFQAMLPNGKVLIWDSVGDNSSETYTNHTFTRAMVWNPSNNTYKRVDVQGYNIFCAGFAHLSNGNILVAGGNKNKDLAGIVQTHIFDWRTETWSHGSDMQSGRWYPSLTTMANGEISIIGGGPAMMEVYQLNGTVRPVAGFTNTTYGGRIYPFTVSRPDTLLQAIGPYQTMYTINTTGNGTTLNNKTRDAVNRQYGSFATYDIGKTLMIGGGSITEAGKANVPTKTVVVVNSNTLTPTVSNTGSLLQGRRQHNATVLADGSVLVTGGMTSAATSGLVDLPNAVTTAERWNPTTGTWTTLASASRIREYHSTAILLPDGRVLTGGGGVCGACTTAGYLEKNIEYFSPPYLYKKDGSGALAARPQITSAAPNVAINSSFTITSPQAAAIRKVGLVALGDVTHSIDQGQRYIPLSFTLSGTNLVVKSPATSGIAPPGYYMLFVVDSAGVPSVAKIVQVAKSTMPTMAGVKNAASKYCIDLPGANITAKTKLRLYTCNNSKAQTMTWLAPDESIRVLGSCLDVPYAKYSSGAKIQIYGCNNSKAQKWQIRADKTIRPVGSQTYCLTAATTANKAALTITKCSTTTRQRWSW